MRLLPGSNNTPGQREDTLRRDFQALFGHPRYFGEGWIPSKEAFDTQYMRALYDRAYEMAKTGYEWKKMPPGM